MLTFTASSVSPARSAFSASFTAASAAAAGKDFVAPDYQKEFYKEKEQKQAEKPAQPTYDQAPREFPEPATKRALAMCLYVGLLPLIFGFAVRDKSDEFITFHLNQALIVTLGAIISALLSAVFVGVVLGIFIFVVAIMGIINAYNGEKKEIPLIGKIQLVK